MQGTLDRFAVEAASTDAARVKPQAPVFSSAEGCWLFDTGGRRFFDLTGGSGAINLGHQHPRVVAAAIEQVQRLTHTGWNIQSDVRARLIEKLGDFSPYDECAVLFAVTGTEATEAALKVARAHTGRRLVITFERGYHGKSTGALTVTWRKQFKQFSALPEDAVAVAPYPLIHSPEPEHQPEACLAALRQTVEESIKAGSPPAAMILEPLQASEGMLPAGKYFLEGVIRLAREHGCLVIFDEIYTGFSRCGAPFYADKLEFLPDLMVIGKALGNGFPISSVIGPRAIIDSLPHGLHTSTFSGHPVACAVGCAVIDVMNETALWEQAARTGETILSFLRELEAAGRLVAAPRGEGLMLGFDCVNREGTPSPESAVAFAAAALEKGIILRHGGYSGCTIKLTPPLTMTGADIDFLLNAIRQITDEI